MDARRKLRNRPPERQDLPRGAALIEEVDAWPPPRFVCKARVALLAPRERELLRWVAKGAVDKQIATKMAVTKNYVMSAMQLVKGKTHCANRMQMASMYERAVGCDE